MLYTVQVKVMPLKELLDPQGKGIGKNITLQVEAANPDAAREIAEEASRKLLANPVMEYFEVSVN
jgi:phosphoribosylformylglycinamidine synthase subunit PurS